MIKLAVIGAGNMAEEHIKVLNCMAGVKVVGVQSRTGRRALDLAQRHGIGLATDQLSDLFAQAKVDGAVVAVTETETEAVCNDVLMYKVPMLVEKPIGLDFSSTERVLQQSLASRVPVFAGLNRRYLESVTKVKRDLMQLSEPRVVHVFDQEDPQSALKNGRPKEVCDSWHIANSIHLIDLFRVFCRGQVISVKEVGSIKLSHFTRVIHSLIKFESGDLGIYHAIWNGPGPWSVIIETANRRYEMRPVEQLWTQTHPSRISCEVNLDGDDKDFKPGFRYQMTEFVKAVKGLENSAITLTDYIESVRLAERIYKGFPYNAT